MAHTIMKQLYNDEKKKYIECEVLVLDEEENLPGTDRREIVLYCVDKENTFSEIADEIPSSIKDMYPETELIEQYEDFDNRS